MIDDEIHAAFNSGGEVLTVPGATVAEMAAMQVGIDLKYPGSGRPDADLPATEQP